MGGQSTVSPLKNISDTARMVALLRAFESERPDAHFKDPYARELAGEQSEAMLRLLRRGGRFNPKIMAVRTRVIDELILEAVRSGVDTVINLACGLDTRAYRMMLPPSLKWIEVDLPDILSFKQEKLHGKRAACQVQWVKLDLKQRHLRQEFLRTAASNAQNVLVLSEGILMYLEAEEVASIAKDLHGQPNIVYWLADLLSPRELRHIHRRYGKQFAAANALPPFAPEEGAGFFKAFGWEAIVAKSFWREARRLDRESRLMKWIRFVSPLLPRKVKNELAKSYGCVLLRRF